MPMNWKNQTAVVRLMIPQALTACRIILASLALFAAILGRHGLAAKLIIYGVVSDILDGIVARRLNATTEFGALFDYYADYLCYIVAPAVLSFMVLNDHTSATAWVIGGMPLLAGAVRYARNSGLLKTEAFEEVGFPGLGTFVYGLLCAGLVLLGNGAILGNQRFRTLVIGAISVLSVMMVTRVRYPKLTVHKGILVPVILSLILMPFVLTKVLAACMVILLISYTVISPFLTHWSSRRFRSQASPESTGDQG